MKREIQLLSELAAALTGRTGAVLKHEDVAIVLEALRLLPSVKRKAIGGEKVEK